jgi:glycosyltransferase involved in cell wall biosynthesis
MSVAGLAAVGAAGVPWLSILVPAYNVERYVRECLESVTRQAKGEGVEIVVIDDCSTDRTIDILKEMEAEDPELLRCERLPVNGGLYKARNLLLEMARGDYVWFLDSDDRMKEGAIASLKGIVARDTPDFVLCDFSVLGVEEGKRWNRRSKRRVVSFDGPQRKFVADRSALIAGMFNAQKMQVWSKIFRRDLLDRSTKLPEGRHFEDIAFSPTVALRASSFYYEPTPWIDYRRTPTGIVSTMTPAKYVELTHALAMAAGTIEPHLADLSTSAVHAFRHFCVKHFVTSLRGLLRYPRDEERARKLEACFDNFRRTVEDDGLALAVEFARNGRLNSWLKLVAWKARARRAIRRDSGRTPSMPRPKAAV